MSATALYILATVIILAITAAYSLGRDHGRREARVLRHLGQLEKK